LFFAKYPKTSEYSESIKLKRCPNATDIPNVFVFQRSSKRWEYPRWRLVKHFSVKSSFNFSADFLIDFCAEKFKNYFEYFETPINIGQSFMSFLL
jgi:hypothetical protein